MFKLNSRKKSDSESLPDSSSNGSQSLRHRAARFFGKAWNSVAYTRWFGELPSLKNEDSRYWLLGHSYTSSQKDDFRFDYMSRIWLSYRDNFPSLNDKNIQTDFGWGCTLRSSQMLVAQALMVEKFGRAWMRLDVTPSGLFNILRLFEDCETSPLGIHSLIGVARKLEYDEPVGRWFSPSEAFILLRNAIAQSHSTLLNHLNILLCSDSCIATKEIVDLSEDWTKKVLLAVPVRLGMDKVNETYYDHIRTLFQMPSFLGLVGGRPRHAVYFVGYAENTLFQLDPHTCQKYTKLDGMESEEDLESFHCKSICAMKFNDMDPSCALGFMIQSSSELANFVDFLSKTGIADNSGGSLDCEQDSNSVSLNNSLFSIVTERPFYDSSLLPRYSQDDTGFEFMMIRFSLQKCLRPQIFNVRTALNDLNIRSISTSQRYMTDEEVDKLFSKVSIELRGHDKNVLLSYTTFLKNACEHLELDSSNIRHFPYVRWLQWALKSKFVHKKAKVQYETRTYIKQMDVFNVTGSTASTFLEYIQRNIPEGVAMKVEYDEICSLPESVRMSVVKSSK